MIARVLVETSHFNIDKYFDYLVPSLLKDKIKVGMRVLVPFTSRTIEAFVVDLTDQSDFKQLKEIIEIVDEKIYLNEEQLNLAEFISKKYLATKISSLQVMLPTALKAKASSNIKINLVPYLSLNKKLDLDKLNPAQREIINYLKDSSLKKKDLIDKFSVSRVNTLINKEYLLVNFIEEYRLVEEKVEKKKLIATKKQAQIIETINTSEDQVFLLHGVTGSGKTFIYIQAIQKIIQEGKQAIVLLPEISITVALLNVFRSYFKDRVAVLHSRLSDGERYDEYRKILREEVDLVIGARSAIFAPFNNLGLIVIDEEHSNTYKQESSPKYDAKDIALKRAQYHNAKVILGSATPSLESMARAKKGLFHLLSLNERPKNVTLPKIEVVDLTKEKNKASSFSLNLKEEIEECLEKNEQIIIFLNRRGYSNLSICSSCGHVIKCPACDISLTYHKSSGMLRCHYCSYAQKDSKRCPNCGEESMMKLGLGTEKLEEELKSTFKAKVLRMDLDTTTTKGSHERIIKAFKNREADILLGTQMISKGLDFENVTLVGVVNADTSLMIPNYRASEETFQLLSQVSGRAGRSDLKGKVIIQSYNPDHYAIKYAQNNDYESFYQEEMKIRRKLSYPPYYFLVSIKVISKEYDLASKESYKISSYLKNNLGDKTIVIGPSMASVFKLRGMYRFSIIIKYKQDPKLYEVLKQMQENFYTDKVKLEIEFNPWNI